ncbi:hypothetical protein [Mordavella massiliensis]|uniref:CbbX protein n=1 Tax=Mordavella massiliensis TaxID=1871024 RepID=A0A938X952_9CLOT|nr:hypothetical protein [Mordavella massiliensis]
MRTLDKYEYRVKTEQMLEYMEKKQYKKAMEIADTIDWRRVKNATMLNNVSEIYENNGEYQKSRDVLFMAYDRAPGSRKIVYRLGTLALKINDPDEASDCYEEFVKLAPKDPNQFILKYKILQARRAPLSEQIEALEDFKKAEYVEKWAYELAKLYHEAGMTTECLEECDDLILWFSEGRYVYQAMELKMKYKPLTPLQQEKYDSMKNASSHMSAAAPADEAEDADQAEPEEESAANGQNEPSVMDAETREIRLDERRSIQEETQAEEEDLPEEAGEEEAADEKAGVKPDAGAAGKASSISRMVKGATLAEALANGVKVASGMDIGEIEKKASKRDEDMRITGQMKIEEILAAWEAKQKDNAEAIEAQKKRDEKKLAEEKREAQRRREEEARRIEEQQRAAEEARKIAEQKAAEEARRLAEEQAEQERILAKQQADEEKRLAQLKEAEEEALLDRIASGEPEEEEAPETIPETGEAEEPAPEIVETEETELETELTGGIVEEEDAVEEAEEFPEEDAATGMTADLRHLMAELEAEEAASAKAAETADLDMDLQRAFDGEEEFLDEEESFDEEDDYEEESFDEDDDYEEYDDIDEDDFDEDFFDEEDGEEEDYEEEDYDEDDYEEVPKEEEIPEEPERKLTRKERRAQKKAEKEAARQTSRLDDLEIEEPTEEEIQRRIQKGKGGVPFDTGFVVTGRYDLSATSEIGLKAGLTEEQKQLFSYFVPVRGMSEQIVEVLDNDRRERRGGTSRTGNILVIGHKGSGKTVLAVDMVKAIQKQRNLKQGKVAIVTGESLNKKDIPSIVQKLRGGAIIIEKAGKLNARTVRDLNLCMEKKTGELLFVLEDQKKALERLFTANPDFKKKFTSRLELPVFINDELVTFGQTYAKENGYKLDEMGILALYSRIDVMQREDHAVSVAEVKEIMDAAIEHSQKANVKHLARRMFRKSTDDSDRIILKEDDFRI